MAKNRFEDSLLGLLIKNIKNMSTDYPKPAFIEPDYRFFVDTGQTAEETMNLVFRLLEKFDNDSQGIWEFVNRLCKSHDVVFAIFYGSKSLISLDEARIMIDESVKRKSIQPGRAPAIARRILKRINVRNVYASQRFLL